MANVGILRTLSQVVWFVATGAISASSFSNRPDHHKSEVVSRFEDT
jgi:hypothetical protein